MFFSSLPMPDLPCCLSAVHHVICDTCTVVFKRQQQFGGVCTSCRPPPDRFDIVVVVIKSLRSGATSRLAWLRLCDPRRTRVRRNADLRSEYRQRRLGRQGRPSAGRIQHNNTMSSVIYSRALVILTLSTHAASHVQRVV